MRVKDLFNFIQKRHDIWVRRNAGEEKPWTNDKILQSYRFCNVYRELDTVTKWFDRHWRSTGENDNDLWFAALVYRLVNLPGTAEDLGYPAPWKHNHFVKALNARKARGYQVFNGAYIVSTNGMTMDKPEYLAMHVLSPAWEQRAQVQWKGATKDSLTNMHKRLTQLNGVGSFIAAQVIADIKYVPRIRDSAYDWWTFAAPGPGSKRGLNRVLGNPVDQSWVDTKWRQELAGLQVAIDPLIAKAGMPRLHAQDLQNCLCEFDKYERARLGEGRPKKLYNGKE